MPPVSTSCKRYLNKMTNREFSPQLMTQNLQVIPMLPRLLCEQLCSLNPDVDRLTFSVVWRMTQDGDVIDEWFGRSVIRSVAKLSYDHAQSFIERPEEEFSVEQLPPISKSTTISDIHKSVLNLYKVRVFMVLLFSTNLYQVLQYYCNE